MFSYTLKIRHIVSRTAFRSFAFIFLACLYFPTACAASLPQATSSHAPEEFCPRPLPGSPVPEPADLRSQNGVLKLELTIRNFRQKDGSTRYCYLLPDGSQSPTLRLHPGDTLLLHLKNELVEEKLSAADLLSLTKQSICTTKPLKKVEKIDACNSGAMTATSTNFHFHGLSVPSVCHQDDVLKTSIQPTDAAFEYKFQIPRNEAPGLYWYHPHIHGFSSKQVQGGASGALIVEGIERAIPEVAGLPERVLVIRDQDLLNPKASPSKSEPVTPRNLIDRDGDAANNGTGFGKPAKDLSLNFVPVPFPDYTRATIKMKPNERQLWRVLNASSVTYLNLAVVFGHAPQQLGIVAIDGVPTKNDGHAASVEWVNHIGVPPGARVEFIVTGPPLGIQALFVTRTVDTGSGGENDPNRALAAMTAAADAPVPQSVLPTTHPALATPTIPWLGSVTPTRVRKLYFSEKVSNPNDPNSPTEFYITVDGEKPKQFDPRSGIPDIIVKQGDVEDWVIENRSTELHAFHIHQIHFLVMDWSGIAIDEPFLRDTVNVPYYNNRMLQYPSVRLRMDFRDPNTVGTFVYHCHLLEHEDGGMMGIVRVERRTKKS
jgi:FtsP/CotA-like multicopper oxidase with cupredoxin domain